MASKSHSAPETHLPKLLRLHTAQEFDALLAEEPCLLDPTVASRLRETEALPGLGRIYQALAQLLEDAREDSHRAWARYQCAVEESQRHGRELTKQTLEIERALRAGRYEEVLEQVEETLPRADETGNVEVCGVLLRQRGRALMKAHSDDRIESQEAGLADLVVAANLLAGDPMAEALATMELGAASLERIEWDRTWNLEHGLAMLRLAEEMLRGTEFEAAFDDHLIDALVAQESGDLAAHVREAEQLARKALAATSREKEVDRWAWAQLRLGQALKRSAEIGERNEAEAELAFSAILAESDRISLPFLLGAASSSLGQMLLRATDDGPDKAVEELVAWLIPPDDDTAAKATLEEARSHLEFAVEHLGDAHPLDLGTALDSLAEVLHRLDDIDDAISRNREALEILRPRTYPEQCRPCGERLGRMLAERADWQEAAAAFELAVEAIEILYHRRKDPAGRDLEARKSVSLGRWAAFAIAKNGDPANAALVLERGRNRELRRRLEAEGEIEELPGLEIFDEALSDDFPLIYVDPTPFGTMLLRATRAQDNTRFDAIFLDGPTGMEVYRHFFLGDAAEATDPKEVLESGASYLLGVSLFEEDPLTSKQEREQLEEKRVRQLRDGLDEIVPWLGEAIAKAIAEAASDVGAAGVTLVPCGIVALAPLHAAEWSEGGGTRCLLDAFPVRYAPSALLLGLAISRAKERDEDESHLVALADPCGDLEASVPEMESIAARFHPDRSTFASGAEATTDFLRDHLSEATHVHLASHAQASLDTQQTGVQLADRFLPALDFDELGEVGARLIVVSACQGATQETAFRPDESFSVSTALLERGAACVIAALWPVDDRATALLMTRFYEEMIDQRVSPAVALGRAQIWMRDLSEQDASTFLAAYPSLEAVLRRQATNGIEKRRGAGGAKLQAQTRPFSHPDFWAAFVAVGV